MFQSIFLQININNEFQPETFHIFGFELYALIDNVLILEASSSRQNHDSANIIYLFAHFAPNSWPEVPRCLDIAESSLMLVDVWLLGYPNR